MGAMIAPSKPVYLLDNAEVRAVFLRALRNGPLPYNVLMGLVKGKCRSPQPGHILNGLERAGRVAQATEWRWLPEGTRRDPRPHFEKHWQYVLPVNAVPADTRPVWEQHVAAHATRPDPEWRCQCYPCSRARQLGLGSPA